MKYSCAGLQRMVSACLLAVFAAVLPFRALGQQAPQITQQPQSQAVLAGSNATFTVVATGQTPLRYQWSFNGANLANGPRISGATNSTLTISKVIGGDAGNYQVVVTNRHGSVTSVVATLTVLFPPSIITSPTNQRVLEGGSASFGVTAAGTEPFYISGSRAELTWRMEIASVARPTRR